MNTHQRWRAKKALWPDGSITTNGEVERWQRNGAGIRLKKGRVIMATNSPGPDNTTKAMEQAERSIKESLSLAAPPLPEPLISDPVARRRCREVEAAARLRGCCTYCGHTWRPRNPSKSVNRCPACMHRGFVRFEEVLN